MNNNIIYVCTVSGFNVAELEACLFHQPKHIILIVSDSQSITSKGKLLQNTLEKELTGSCFYRLDNETTNIKLHGNDIENAIEWINTVLVPKIDEIKHTSSAKTPLYLNSTGGTKAMLMALITSIQWDKIDYTPSERNKIQSITPDLKKLPNPKAMAKIVKSEIKSATAIQAASLYATEVRESALNTVTQYPSSSKIALSIWNGLNANDPKVLGLLNILNILWLDREFKDSYKYWTWAELKDKLDPESDLNNLSNQDIQKIFTETFLPLYQDYSKTASENTKKSVSLTIDDQGMQLPSNNKDYKSIREWIKGFWLEQLVFSWILESDIPPEQITQSLTSGNSKDSNLQREADIFIHHKNISYIIEIKADLPEGKKVQDFEQQLNSLKDRFGKTKKILFVGAKLSKKLQTKPNKWKSFELRCKTAGISLCDDKDSLLTALGLRSFNN
jgi:hypothetical protein